MIRLKGKMQYFEYSVLSQFPSQLSQIPSKYSWPVDRFVELHFKFKISHYLRYAAFS